MVKIGKVISIEINPPEYTPHLINEKFQVDRIESKEQEQIPEQKLDKKKKVESNRHKAALITQNIKKDNNSSTPKTQSNKFKIEDIIEIGPKGVTNKQMIPAIQQAIENNSGEKIQILKASYPEVFEGSCKYLKKNIIEKMKALIT